MNIEANEGRKKPLAERDEPPPFLRSWNRIYVAIALYTLALIVALYLITVALNR
jgi:hypothetical protein